MVRKIKAKQVLRLHARSLSGRSIARSLGISRDSVAAVLKAAADGDVSYAGVESKSDDEVYSLLFPGRNEHVPAYRRPDWPMIHRELARTGVTLRLLHAEYRDSCLSQGVPAMGYDRFCKLYQAYVVANGITSRVERKAGSTIEVDWAGPTLEIVDPVTGETSSVYLFVACLPFSRYAFAEPALDMREKTWLACHVAMYEWLDGSTPRLVPDNLKTGVTAHPKEGEVVPDERYRALADHYSAAVLPGRVRHPRDKASVENTVWHVPWPWPAR
jgi:transposase